MKTLIILLAIFLIPFNTFSKESYNRADDRAYRVPEKFNSNLDELTNYLIQPFQNSEELKARVIFAWIVYNIQYDAYELKTSYEWNRADSDLYCFTDDTQKIHCAKQSPFDTFKKRSGVCRHFADLFQYMATKAGLKSVIITGQSMKQGHAWNAVKIKDKWHLLDATWAASSQNAFRGIKTDKSYKRAIEIRERKIKNNRIKASKRIKEEWFFAHPKQFFKTHTPHDKQWKLF